MPLLNSLTTIQVSSSFSNASFNSAYVETYSGSCSVPVPLFASTVVGIKPTSITKHSRRLSIRIFIFVFINSFSFSDFLVAIQGSFRKLPMYGIREDDVYFSFCRKACGSKRQYQPPPFSAPAAFRNICFPQFGQYSEPGANTVSQSGQQACCRL